MSVSNQELWELAQRVREWIKAVRLSRCRELASALDPLLESADRLQSARRGLELCASRQWLLAAGEVAKRLSSSLGCLAYHVARLQGLAGGMENQVLSVAELAEELRQVEHEFGNLHYDRKNQIAAVVTDPIELAGVYLGEFEIRLLLSDRHPSHGLDGMYRVVALDPHCASSDDTVTHPHVRSECLCAGDAQAALQSALAQGRLCDFFLLVRSVLNQYNPSSPFVQLANWDGESCYDCGCNLGGGSSSCSHCENDFCDECMSYCHHCDRSYCHDCLTTCQACGESVCSDCRRRCPDCHTAICTTCLEENQCSCKQEKENDHEPTTAATPEATPAS